MLGSQVGRTRRQNSRSGKKQKSPPLSPLLPPKKIPLKNFVRLLKSRFSSLCVSRPPPLLLALHLIALERSSSQHFEGLLLRSAPPIGSHSLLLGDPLVQGKDRRLSRPGTSRAVSTPSSPFTSPRQRVVCIRYNIYHIYIQVFPVEKNNFFFLLRWVTRRLSLSLQPV